MELNKNKTKKALKCYKNNFCNKSIRHWRETCWYVTVEKAILIYMDIYIYIYAFTTRTVEPLFKTTTNSSQSGLKKRVVLGERSICIWTWNSSLKVWTEQVVLKKKGCSGSGVTGNGQNKSTHSQKPSYARLSMVTVNRWPKCMLGFCAKPKSCPESNSVQIVQKSFRWDYKLRSPLCIHMQKDYKHTYTHIYIYMCMWKILQTIYIYICVHVKNPADHVRLSRVGKH